MAKLRINGDSSGYVDLEAPNAASSSTLDLDQIPQKNATNTFSTINKFADLLVDLVVAVLCISFLAVFFSFLIGVFSSWL